MASYATSPLEVEANYFAAGLLMPSFLFTKEAEGHSFSFATLRKQAEAFGTSLTATAIRHVELSKEYVAVIASRGGRIQWWRGSSSFAEVFHICRDNELSSRTVARGVNGCRGPAASPAAEEVDIGAWSERNDTDSCSIFVEESIYMERYGQTMTLLHLP